MSDFDQRKQDVGTQQNAETINNSSSSTATASGDGSVAVVNSGTGDVSVNYHGLSEKEFNYLLLKLDDLTSDKETQKRLLNNLLDQVDTQKLTITDLNQQIDKQKAKIKEILASDSITDKVKELISQGKLEEAETLVDKQYEEKLKKEEKLLAAKHFERGSVKELRIKYKEAFKAYEKAVSLQPENTEYLNKAGMMAHTLAKYDKAIGYFELALVSGLKTYGEDHPAVARRRNNLGGVWKALGEYQKAIEYYELALASDLKTYGEDHPDVAIRRNNLGIAWDSLGFPGEISKGD